MPFQPEVRYEHPEPKVDPAQKQQPVKRRDDKRMLEKIKQLEQKISNLEKTTTEDQRNAEM